MTHLDTLIRHFVSAEKIVFFTGAGVSTASGIPDFRSQKGLAGSVPDFERRLSINYLKQNPRKFWEFYNQYLKLPEGVQPNAAHLFMAELGKRRDVTIITQNVDGLHEKAGHTTVLPLHGRREITCEICNEVTSDFPEHNDCSQQRYSKKGNLRPSRTRPNVVLYGERLDSNLMRQAADAVTYADLVVAVGSSLKVYPAAGLLELPMIAPLYYLNNEAHPEGFTPSVVVRNIIGDFIPLFKQMLVRLQQSE